MKYKFDPRTTMLLIALTSTLSVIAVNIRYLLIMFLLTFICCFAFGAKPLQGLLRLRKFLSMLLFIALIQSLTLKGGTVLIELFGAKFLTTQGLDSALSFVLRMSILILAVLLGSKHDSSEMISGLVKLKIPYELAFMTGIAIRFLPMFRQEFQDRLNAVALRGINIKKLGLGKKIKLYSYIIVPTISGSIIKSRDIASSMETRAFRAYPTRTPIREYKFKSLDYVLCIISLIIFILIIYLMYFRRI